MALAIPIHDLISIVFIVDRRLSQQYKNLETRYLVDGKCYPKQFCYGNKIVSSGLLIVDKRFLATLSMSFYPQKESCMLLYITQV